MADPLRDKFQKTTLCAGGMGPFNRAGGYGAPTKKHHHCMVFKRSQRGFVRKRPGPEPMSRTRSPSLSSSYYSSEIHVHVQILITIQGYLAGFVPGVPRHQLQLRCNQGKPVRVSRFDFAFFQETLKLPDEVHHVCHFCASCRLSRLKRHRTHPIQLRRLRSVVIPNSLASSRRRSNCGRGAIGTSRRK